uniref:Uncharacterized protein n=1 Tax=Acrobeloides nanus TaxID=290746 RepID=A0A914E0K4_9BILA
MESVFLNQCNIQSFQGHRCFENGLLICNQAKILIVRLDALNHHNDERYILREGLFRQIVLHQLKPCFQNLFENINITFADELGVDYSTNDLNSSAGFILGEKFTHRGQNNNNNTSVLMEHFKYFFRYTNNNNTLNLAFIFSDEARIRGTSTVNAYMQRGQF